MALIYGSIYSFQGNYGTHYIMISIDYSHQRSGTTQQYRFTGTLWLQPASGTSTRYTNNLNLAISCSGGDAWSTNYASSAYNWSTDFDTGWLSVANKTSGNVSVSFSCKDTNNSNWCNWSDSRSLGVDPAQSTISSVIAGTTLSGPTINITKYNSGFTDNITLSYNNKSITRSNFTSSQLVFTEAERFIIYQAQNAGTTASWTISGQTMSGQTSMGTYSGSVNIYTESLSTITNVTNFNVESSNPAFTMSNACGGKTTVTATLFAGGLSEVEIYRLTKFTGGKTNFTATVSAQDIYDFNSDSSSGTVYWTAITYINDTQVGITSYESTYNFVQSLCGPSLTSCKYSIADTQTRNLKSSSGTYYNFTDNTDSGKFIENLTHLGLKFQGSVASNKGSPTITRYYVHISGKSEIAASGTSGEQTIVDTGALPSVPPSNNGTVEVFIEDSRGFKDSKTLNYTLNGYFTPSYSQVSAARNQMSATNPNQDLYIKASLIISIPGYIATYLQNSASSSYYIKYQYSSNGGTSWTTDANDIKSQFTISGNTMNLTNYQLATSFDRNTQYLVRFVISAYPYSQTYTSSSVTIPISAPIISRRQGKVGINKVPSLATLDVGGTIYSSGAATVASLTSNSTITATSTVTANTTLKAGSTAATQSSLSSDALYVYGVKMIWYE